MKKPILKLLLLAGVAVVMAACSKKDSDSPGGSNSSIVGKWTPMTDTTYTYDNNNALISTYVTGIEDGDYVQFNSNGSGSEEEYGITITFSYTFNSNVIRLVYKGSNIPGGFTTEPIQNVIVKQVDAHSMYTEQIIPDTISPGVIYTEKDYTHFKK